MQHSKIQAYLKQYSTGTGGRTCILYNKVAILNWLLTLFVVRMNKEWTFQIQVQLLKGYDYGSLSYFIIVKNKLVNKIEKKIGRNIV